MLAHESAANWSLEVNIELFSSADKIGRNFLRLIWSSLLWTSKGLGWLLSPISAAESDLQVRCNLKKRSTRATIFACPMAGQTMREFCCETRILFMRWICCHGSRAAGLGDDVL